LDRRIIQLARDPVALARDIAVYLRCGYRLLAGRALDTFPMTHHVDCVAVLARWRPLLDWASGRHQGRRPALGCC
jgi:hypothetical protein